jgi:site-specific DNA-adenine methylase
MLVRNVFFSCCNYSKCLDKVVTGDIIYLDPPYFGNNIFIDYLKEGFNYSEFFKFTKNLEERKISYILSNILNAEILYRYSNNVYKFFYLEVTEGMVNTQKKRMEVLITFL